MNYPKMIRNLGLGERVFLIHFATTVLVLLWATVGENYGGGSALVSTVLLILSVPLFFLALPVCWNPTLFQGAMIIATIFVNSALVGYGTAGLVTRIANWFVRKHPPSKRTKAEPEAHVGGHDP